MLHSTQQTYNFNFIRHIQNRNSTENKLLIISSNGLKQSNYEQYCVLNQNSQNFLPATALIKIVDS